MEKVRNVILLLVAIWIGGRYIYYGSLVRSCSYTEASSPPPKHLLDGKIVVSKDAFLVSGQDLNYACLPEFGAITFELVGSDVISNNTIGRHYFEKNGQKVADLKLGSKEFHLKKIVAITSHGLITIDSGPGPIRYLVLTDEQGIEYKIATVHLGMNEQDSFLKFVSQHIEGDLTVRNFGF